MTTEAPVRPNCWDCKWSRNIPGDAHKKCAHPATVGASAMTAAATLKVAGATQGVVGGWFMWPFNFDPVWLVSCNGFEATS